MLAVVTLREDGVSPFVGFEIDLCLRSRKPLLVFVEDVLPDDVVPARVLQRRFSRGAFLRQVREHRHAMRVFKSYLGDDPPPRYQPEVAQRSCVLTGDETLGADVSRSLDAMVTGRGYRVIRPDGSPADEAGVTDALCQAHLAIAFIDATSPTVHYCRGLLHGAAVPTLEFTSNPPSRPPVGIPAEFTPRIVRPAIGPQEVCAIAEEQLAIAEEDFLELDDQDKVDAYFELLVDIGAQRGNYSEEDHERVVNQIMGDQINVSGQVGAVGRHSHAENITFVQAWDRLSEGTDAAALAAELDRLRQHLRAEANDPEHDVAVAAVAEAQLKAQGGDGPAALEQLSALSRVKGAGKWVVGAATTIGTTVAAAALKAVLGL